jgi:hypothetical protein
MTALLDHPCLLFVVTLVLLWTASSSGAIFRRWLRLSDSALDEDHFDMVLGATLTLLGLIIGFTFSMAVNRYDQRKDYEEQEANAIGTEYLRLEVLPGEDARRARSFMREYLKQRIVFYTNRDPETLRRCHAETSQLQSVLWASVTPFANARPTGISALVLSGMNDVFNSEGYTEAIWRNRIPAAAWFLLVAIAVFSNFLLSCRSQRNRVGMLMVFPLVLSISFFLIAEIESPRSGIIRVHAHNLVELANALSAAK